MHLDWRGRLFGMNRGAEAAGDTACSNRLNKDEKQTRCGLTGWYILCNNNSLTLFGRRALVVGSSNTLPATPRPIPAAPRSSAYFFSHRISSPPVFPDPRYRSLLLPVIGPILFLTVAPHRPILSSQIPQLVLIFLSRHLVALEFDRGWQP